MITFPLIDMSIAPPLLGPVLLVKEQEIISTFPLVGSEELEFVELAPSSLLVWLVKLLEVLTTAGESSSVLSASAEG